MGHMMPTQKHTGPGPAYLEQQHEYAEGDEPTQEATKLGLDLQPTGHTCLQTYAMQRLKLNVMECTQQRKP